MLYFWFFDGLLALVSFYSASLMIQRGNTSVFSVAFFFLGIAALVGSVRYGLNLQQSLQGAHQLLSELYAISGHLLISVGLLSLAQVITLNRRRTLYWLVIALSLFVLFYWITPILFGSAFSASLILGVVMAGSCFFVSVRLLWGHKKIEAVVLVLATVLYLFNGLFVVGSEQLLFGWDIRAAVFHILLSVWCLVMTWLVLRLRRS